MIPDSQCDVHGNSNNPLGSPETALAENEPIKLQEWPQETDISKEALIRQN